MSKFLNFWLRLLQEERGEVDITPEPAAAEPVAASPEPAADPVAQPTEPADSVDAPFADLDAAMSAVLPQDEPAQATTDGQTAQVPEEFQAALSISPFVKDAQTLQQAVLAANEVWSVAAGQIPARNLLEGIKQADPQGYESIVADLKDYLGVQGQQNQAPNPIEALKTANPAVFNAINQYVQQQTGQTLDAPQDPRDARLAALEAKYAEEQQQREIEAHNAQVEAASKKASEFMAQTIKGTFAEGLQDRFLAPGTGLLWLKAMQLNIPADRMQAEILSGKTDTLKKVWSAVQKDEIHALRQYNKNLIAQHKKLANGVPGVKGAKVESKTNGLPEYKDGETPGQYAVRIASLVQ